MRLFTAGSRQQKFKFYKDIAVYNRQFAYFQNLTQNFENAKDVRIYNMAGYIIGRINHFHNCAGQIFNRMFLKQRRHDGFTAVDIQTQTLAAYGFAVWSVLQRKIMIGDFTMYISAANQFSSVATQLMAKLVDLQMLGRVLQDYLAFEQLPCQSSSGSRKIALMFREYTTSDAVGGKYDPMATHFFNGEVAMFPNGPWMIPDFSEAEKAPEGFYDKVGIMLMPCAGMEMVPTPGDMVGAKEEEKIKAAVDFLKFETRPENQIKALEMTGLQPVSNDLEIPADLTESDPLMAEVLEIQNHAKMTYGQNQAYWYQNTIDTFSTGAS